MSDPTRVNLQILDSINATQEATMSPGVVRTSGAGKAYQSIAQSMAIAVQDATDHLRNISTISTTAVGAAMAQLLATGDVEKYGPILQSAQGMVASGAFTFETIGKNAADILNRFPSG